jgi:hypothetical protein
MRFKGRDMRIARLRAGFSSQSEFARLCGWSQTKQFALENGKLDDTEAHELTIDQVDTINAALSQK